MSEANKTGATRERKRLTITKQDLDEAFAQNSLTEGQVDSVWRSLQKQFAQQPQFDLAHVAWYIGSLVVMVAMGWFLAQVSDTYGAVATLATSAVYTALLVLAGNRVWFNQGLKVAGGLLITLAVSITPLTVGALEKVTGADVFSTGSQFVLEIATVIAGLIALRRFKFPFLTAPIAAATWSMAFTVTELLFSGAQFSLWHAHLYVSMAFGLAMIAVAFFVDKRSDEDYAFWGYLFGVAAFWISLSMLDSGSELGKFFYLLINLGMMLVSVLLARRVFIVAGTVGMLGYIFHLSWTLFSGSILFPFALSAIGAGIWWLGIKYHRNQERIDNAILSVVPEALRRQLPERRV